MEDGRCLVRVLGPIEVVIFGAIHPLRPMSRKLLAVLAASPGRLVRAERVLDDLWPDGAPPSAAKTLQTHVVHLRRVIGHNAIVYRAAGYQLDLAVVDLDARELQRLVEQAQAEVLTGHIDAALTMLRAATDLIHGVPFDEFAIDEFAGPEVARLSELLLQAIELEAECATSLGEPKSVVATLERLVTEQPLRESAWIRLIRAYAALGRDADATRAAARAVAVLRHEVHAAPGAELAAAIDSLKKAAPTGAPNGKVAPVLAALHDPSHVGREEPLARLMSYLSTRPAGVARLVLITGEPGIGKTSLLAAVAHRIATDGATVLFGRCARDDPSSCAPIRQLLGTDETPDLDSVGLHPLGKVALGRYVFTDNSARTPLAFGEQSLERFHLQCAIVEMLRVTANGRHIVLAIDDLHWVDAATLAILGPLINATAGLQVDLVATTRSDPGPWQRVVADAIERDCSITVELEGLDRVAIETLIARQIDQAPPSLASEVHRRTSGNPLLVGAMLDDLRRRGSTSASAVPLNISLLIAGRMGRLDRDTVAVLQAAAVAGPTFATTLLSDVSDLDPHVVERSIGIAEADHMIVPNELQRFAHRFTHELFREAIYEVLPSSVRLELHRRIAKYLNERSDADPSAARHWIEAGELSKAAHALLRSAERERAFQRRDSSLQLATQGVALAESGDVSDTLHSELLLLQAELLVELGHLAEARLSVLAVRPLVGRRTLAYVRRERLGAKLCSADGDWDGAAEHLRHGIAELRHIGAPGDSDVFDAVWCDVHIDFAWLHYRGTVHTHIPMREFEDGLRLVRHHGNARQRTELPQVLAAIENRQRRFRSSDRALDLAHRSLMAARELDDPVEVADKTFSVGFHLFLRGRLDEAEDRLSASHALFADSGADARSMVPLVYLAVVSRLRGDVESTHRRAGTSLEAARRLQSAIYTATSLANLGWCALRTGDFDVASETLEEALTTWADPHFSTYPFHGYAIWPMLAIHQRRGTAPTHATHLSLRLLAPSQQGLPMVVEQALQSGDLDSALRWAAEQNLA